MKKIFFLILLIFNSIKTLELNVQAKEHAKMNLLLIIEGENTQNINKVAEIVKADLEFGDQFKVEIQNISTIKTKKEIFELQKQGFPFIVFINENKKQGIDWRLYDATTANMISGKKIYLQENNFSLPHILASQISKELTGDENMFCSAIVGCKKVKKFSHVYILHPVEFACELSKAKALVTESTTCLAPRWHIQKPLLYYSKHTPYNVRLMSLDLNKTKRIVSNFDGINMSPTISPSGKVVVSLTNNGKEKLFQYDYDNLLKRGKFTPLTKNNIHAISPYFIDDNRIVFCAIDQLNNPKIAILYLNNSELEYVTKNGYCVCPTFCAKNQKIAYCKKVDGYMQIFVCDLDNDEHKQLTFDNTHKDSCSWSPCGNYLSFSVENGGKNRIAIFNLLTEKIKYITPENENWSSPAWSANYNEIPFL